MYVLLNPQDQKFIASGGIFFGWYFDFYQLASRFNERFITVPGITV